MTRSALRVVVPAAIGTLLLCAAGCGASNGEGGSSSGARSSTADVIGVPKSADDLDALCAYLRGDVLDQLPKPEIEGSSGSSSSRSSNGDRGLGCFDDGLIGVAVEADDPSALASIEADIQKVDDFGGSTSSTRTLGGVSGTWDYYSEDAGTVGSFAGRSGDRLITVTYSCIVGDACPGTSEKSVSDALDGYVERARRIPLPDTVLGD